MNNYTLITAMLLEMKNSKKKKKKGKLKAREGNGNPLQYSCLKNSMDRGAWRAIVHGVAKSWT